MRIAGLETGAERDARETGTRRRLAATDRSQAERVQRTRPASHWDDPVEHPVGPPYGTGSAVRAADVLDQTAPSVAALLRRAAR